MRKRYSNAWRLIVIALVLMCQLPVLTSCDDDESKSTVIDYYLNVEEAFLVNGSNETISRYENPVTRMTQCAVQTLITMTTFIILHILITPLRHFLTRFTKIMILKAFALHTSRP